MNKFSKFMIIAELLAALLYGISFFASQMFKSNSVMYKACLVAGLISLAVFLILCAIDFIVNIFIQWRTSLPNLLSIGAVACVLYVFNIDILVALEIALLAVAVLLFILSLIINWKSVLFWLLVLVAAWVADFMLTGGTGIVVFLVALICAFISSVINKRKGSV